jgi:Phosphoinositide phospholipase C, Ca2+-dependent
MGFRTTAMRTAMLAWILTLGCCAVAQTECDLRAKAEAVRPECARAWIDENLRLNDLSSIGTHNSYKRAIPDAEMKLLRLRRAAVADTLDYAHAPLERQLDAGARQLELDVVIDAEGGRFANPLGPRMAGTTIDPALAAELALPGFKVLHVPDIDFRSQCARFVVCLREIKAWSQQHPTHVPILITINAKDSGASVPGAAPVAKFDTAAFDALDAEIASVFAREELITPDQVQGSYPTLREAVLAGNWPKLRDARGKILFALDESPAKVATYRGERRSLQGRLMFVNTEESSPAAAYLTLNEPREDYQRIRDVVRSGFLVRTRADADTREARTGDTRRREIALGSGAQYVSTDYMQPDSRFGIYSVRLPEGAVAVCNPARAAERCASLIIGE